MKNPISHPLVRGSIDLVQGNLVHGWFYGYGREMRPLVMVNGRSAALVRDQVPRPDVCSALGIAEDERPGFIFELPGASSGEVVELYAAGPSSCTLVAEKELTRAVIEQNLLAQAARAARIARQSDAVGIVCWDGAHNPAGRAYELYQISAKNFPTVLICYLNDEFGDKLWHPLQNEDINIITIPWRKRFSSEKLLHDLGINFQTIWVCKPRLPSFLLASAIARKETRVILDIDDNENSFIRASDFHNAYEYQGVNFSEYLLEQIPVRTVSNSALADLYGGKVIRHVREKLPFRPVKSDGKIHIGFIGSARPHKNVAAIARSIRIMAENTGLPLIFDVYGDLIPAELESELLAAGAVFHGPVGISELPDVMQSLHALVSGFYIDSIDFEITAPVNWQTPAKISDALAAGRPALVPHSPAVADLGSIPGVYLFDNQNFASQLLNALACKSVITLPDEFTPAGASESFVKLVHETAPANSLPGLIYHEDNNGRPVIVLIWKQQDAAIYGRRIDQIARGLAQAYPDYRIIVCEFFWPFGELATNDNFSSDLGLQKEWLDHKQLGTIQNGVFYKAFRIANEDELRDEFETYLIQNKIYPHNSMFILFPIIKQYDNIKNILRPYVTLADIVDNNLSWANDESERVYIMGQYFEIMKNATSVVFNSSVNLDYFMERSYIQPEKSHIICNWYDFPKGFRPESQPSQDDVKHIFYSGNLNDRIDWKMLLLVASLPGVKLHIAGVADRRKKQLDALLAAGAIYHGVLEEHQVLFLLNRMDACIVPHTLDSVSCYMDPMKVEMYRAAGLPVVLPKWLTHGKGDLSYDNATELAKIIANLAKRTCGPIHLNMDFTSRDAYIGLVKKLHPALQD